MCSSLSACFSLRNALAQLHPRPDYAPTVAKCCKRLLQLSSESGAEAGPLLLPLAGPLLRSLPEPLYRDPPRRIGYGAFAWASAWQWL